MGGPSGLPRISIRGLKLTKRFNPSGEDDLEIGTLWRDLEITLGTYDQPSEELAFRAAKKLPSLINPKESSRWVFFRTKDLLIKKLGSEQAAIDMLVRNPELMLHPKYDGLNPKLESMLDVDDIKSVAPSQGGFPVPVALGVVAVAALAAFVANGQLVQ